MYLKAGPALFVMDIFAAVLCHIKIIEILVVFAIPIAINSFNNSKCRAVSFRWANTVNT